MKSKQFLQEIRTVGGLPRAVLKKIELRGREVTFFLVTDVGYSAEDRRSAEQIASKFVPQGCTARVDLMKSVPSEEGVRQKIAEILRRRAPAVAAFVDPSKISVSVDGKGGRFLIEVGEEDRAMLGGDAAVDGIHEELERNFCGSWYGEFSYVKKSRGEIERDDVPPPEPVLLPRTFAVCGFAPIDGAEPVPARATYIADLTGVMQGVTVCGAISYIEERTTKSGKPFFSITVSDGTSSLRCSYFTRVKTLEKIRSIRQGDTVCLTGDNELYNGALSFRVKYIDFGAPPDDFVPEARLSRPVPARYTCVFPSPDSDLVQGMMFGETAVPARARSKKYVVFDLETTGLGNSASNMDRIIEVGAVKIVEGKICEKFTSFVACPVRLPQEIVALTGITDDMLVGAPPVESVIADFYKFCDGCELVAHNAPFDSKFVRFYGEKEGYRFDHMLHDTVSLAQSLVSLKNYKLDTVAAHFGFTFNHHRAYDDAFVTAKIFLQLLRLQG